MVFRQSYKSKKKSLPVIIFMVPERTSCVQYSDIFHFRLNSSGLPFPIQTSTPIDNMFFAAFTSRCQSVEQVLHSSTPLPRVCEAASRFSERHLLQIFEVLYSSIVIAISPPSLSLFFSDLHKTPVTPDLLFLSLTRSLPNIPSPKIIKGIFLGLSSYFRGRHLFVLQKKRVNFQP